MRTSQGGHDVPTEKLVDRFPRTLKNLRLATERLPLVYVFDNDDLSEPYRLIGIVKNGCFASAYPNRPLPSWAAFLEQ